MAQDITYSPWERTKSLWLCLKTTLLLFGLLWPFSFVSASLISLIKFIHWLKFSTDKRQAEDTGGWDGGGQKGPWGPATFHLLHFSWLYIYLPGVLSYFHPFYHFLILKCIFSTQTCSLSSRHMYPVGCGSLLLLSPLGISPCTRLNPSCQWDAPSWLKIHPYSMILSWRMGTQLPKWENLERDHPWSHHTLSAPYPLLSLYQGQLSLAWPFSNLGIFSILFSSTLSVPPRIKARFRVI